MKTLIVTVMIGLLTIGTSFSQQKYASKETKEVIEKMIKSHGGMEKWKSLKNVLITNCSLKTTQTFQY